MTRLENITNELVAPLWCIFNNVDDILSLSHIRTSNKNAIKPIPPRKIFEVLLHVLRIGCQWEALPGAKNTNGALARAPLAQQAVGRNPTDIEQVQPVNRRPICPAIDRRDRSQQA